MKSFWQIIRIGHRIIGIPAGILLTIWFISGLVLIYKPFPGITDQEYLMHKETIDTRDLQPADSVWSALENRSITSIETLHLERERGQNTFFIQTEEDILRLSKDLEWQKPFSPTSHDLINYARQWVDADITRIDTLPECDQWTQFSRYENNLPMLRFHFADDKRSWIYLDSKTGEVVQQSTYTERLWSWFGTIPHKFYFKFLRQHTDLWIAVLSIAAALAAVDVLLGLILGIRLLIISKRKTRKWGSPYRKRAYYWHHVLGLIFSILLFTWAFSGAMALQKIPEWIAARAEKRTRPTDIYGKTLPLAAYRLDYRLALAQYPDAKKIEWLHLGNYPFYRIDTPEKSYYIDASNDNEVRPLNIPMDEFISVVYRIHGKSTTLDTTTLQQYDRYYLTAFEPLPLPVYRIRVKDSVSSLYYFNPSDADYRYLDRNRQVKAWVFRELHFLQYKALVHNHTLWTLVIWVTVLGCILASLTGVWLSIIYLKRNFKRRRR